MDISNDPMRNACSRLLMLACVSAIGLPVSAYAYSRTETIQYYDNTNKWVLGQVASRSYDGVLASRMEYDTTFAMPIKVEKYGKLQAQFTYNADGTISTIEDGRGNKTILSDWRRGAPQSIAHADGTVQKVVVGDQGWILQRTDENSFSTSMTYDAMGRLTGVAYPVGDDVPWNGLSSSFVKVDADEYGISSGHWRETTKVGSLVRSVYYDALWRPLLVAEYDSASPQVTSRFVGYEYDHNGRVVFESYPSANANSDKGVWTAYDAVGRPTSVSQDSEQGLLTTTTSYQVDANGAFTLVRDPRGSETRTWYRMLGQPSYEFPIRVQQPEGVLTRIDRDVFGKPLAIIQGALDGSTQVARLYAYNGNQELCKISEPETGASLMGYDAAGNLAWSASGLPTTAPCEANGTAADVAARRISRAYDARNRLTLLTLPDGNGNQSWKYTLDGKPSEVATSYEGSGNRVVNTYSYNKRRLLTAESLAQTGMDQWQLGYTYDANGAIAGINYPSKMYVEYSPNALGQPTKAGVYASGVMYHPNGRMSQFFYGNGLRHTEEQNLRTLPSGISDGTVLGQQFSYDVVGNTTKILDSITPSRSRTMAYDGRDRLVGATSQAFGGGQTISYTYDALDNLKSSALSGVREFNYLYDAANRVTNIRDGQGATIIGMSYDERGNLSGKNGQVYKFDFANRLKEAVGKEAYRYDALGHRSSSSSSGIYIQSMYGQDGILRRQDNYRSLISTEYVYLNGALIAMLESPLSAQQPNPPTDPEPGQPGAGIPLPPTNAKFKNVNMDWDTGIELSWSASVGAEYYEIRDISEFSPPEGKIYNVGRALSKSWNLMREGFTFGEFSVRACSAAGCSSWAAASY